MMEKTEGRYRVEVVVDNTGKWCGNELRFDTPNAAATYARNLFER